MFKNVCINIIFLIFFLTPNFCLGDLKVRVWPNKIAYQVNEDCLFNIHIKNEDPNDRTIKLIVFVEYEIETEKLIFEQDTIIKGNEEKVVRVTWRFDSPVLGCAVKAHVLEFNKKIASAEEYFSVVKEKKEIVRVGIAGQLRVSGSLSPIEKEYNRFFVEEGLRKGYVNIVEAHGLYACPFYRLIPNEEEMKNDFLPGGFPYSISGTLDQIKQLKKNGILITCYGFFMPHAPASLELVRARPDLVMRFERGQAAFGEFNVKEIEDEKNYTKENFKLVYVGCMVDQLSKEVMDIHINALCKAKEFWDVDGVRWDGHISPRYYYTLGNTYFNYKGEPVPPIETVDHLTAQNLRYIKDAIRKVYPDYVFMANHIWQMGGVLVKNGHSEEYAALAEGGTGICNEPFRHAYIRGNPFNKWSQMASMLVFESDKANEYGGYAYAYPPTPWEVSPVITRFIYSILYATRNRPWFAIALYGPFMRGAQSFIKQDDLSHFESAVPIARFATRYSSILFGYNMERHKEPERFLAVHGDRDIWWKEFVHIRKISDTERQVVVDLLNPPLTEFVNPNADEKEIPPPQKEVKITIKVRADEKVTSAYFLSPDIEGMKMKLSLLPDEGAGSIKVYDPSAGKSVEMKQSGSGVVRVIVPELKYWGIVVFNIEKQ